MQQKINPYLLFAGGLASTFLTAGLFVAFKVPEALLRYQPIIAPVIFLSFFLATCVPNVYVQLGAWGIMSLSSGLRFAVFFLVLQEVGNAYEMTSSFFLIVGSLVWTFFVAWKVLTGWQQKRPMEFNVAVVTMAQLAIGILLQLAIFPQR